jgi:hypothetical protein
MLDTARDAGQTGSLLAHRSSAMASRRMITIISKNPIPLTTVSSTSWALPPSQRQKDNGRPEELRAWSYGGEKMGSPAPWLPSQTYSSLEPEPSANRCPAVRWCTSGLQGPGEISTLLFAVKFFLQNSIFPEWAMLGSNQRPLPCESEACSFAMVRHYPIFAFPSLIARYPRRGRPPSFAPVVVKLSSDHRLPTSHFKNHWITYADFGKNADQA